MPEGGFVRIQSGRTLLIADAGPPPSPGFDAGAHAGTLSFELSIGRERMIVNCGGGIQPAWRDALRATAAHSTLTVDDTSSSEVRQGGIGRRPSDITVEHRQASGAHWLDMSHDGYKAAFGALHHRRIYIAEGGEDLRGEDSLDADRPLPFTLRFHLHPSVTAVRDKAEQPAGDEEGGSVTLTLPSGTIWRLRSDSGQLSVEDSIYLGGGTPRRCTQVVINVTPSAAPDEADTGAGAVASAEAAAAMDGADPAEAAAQPAKPASQIVRWAIIRVAS